MFCHYKHNKTKLSNLNWGESTMRFVLNSQVWSCVSYRIGAEEEDKADDLLEDGLHLLVAALSNGGQRHQPGMAVLPVS